MGEVLTIEKSLGGCAEPTGHYSQDKQEVQCLV